MYSQGDILLGVERDGVPITLSTAPHPIIIVGPPGSGASTLIDIWAFRCISAGVRIITIGHRKRQHVSLVGILAAHPPMPNWGSLALDDSADPLPDLSRVVYAHIHYTSPPEQAIARTLGRITDLARAGGLQMWPTLVIIDEPALLVDALAGRWAEVLADWPFLGVRLCLCVDALEALTAAKHPHSRGMVLAADTWVLVGDPHRYWSRDWWEPFILLTAIPIRVKVPFDPLHRGELMVVTYHGYAAGSLTPATAVERAILFARDQDDMLQRPPMV